MMSFRFLLTLKLSLFSILFCFFDKPLIAFSQTVNEVKSNPLLVEFQDDLLPRIKRDLTNLEIKRIENKIVELDTLADEELKNGNDDVAFALWYRAINLSRVLDTKKEIKMITKVGSIAWDKTRNSDLNFLNERLVILESQYTKNNQLDPDYLPLFITAYDSLHNLDRAKIIHEQNLKLARSNNDNETLKKSLQRLGQLHLAKFDYYRAEPIFQELLNIARLEKDYLAEGIYLRQLAEISGQIVNPENAVQYKKELRENYVKNQNLLNLAMINIAIGDDYKTLKNPEESAKYYQEAFSLAWSLKQYSIAGDALEKLGKLYQEYEQLDSAVTIYQELIKVHQLSYNYYGLMNTYDYLGLIYNKKQEENLALKSYQKALEIARSLSYKEDYFLTKISEIENNHQQQ